MGKQRLASVTEIEKQLKQKKFLPVYFIFGEDSFQVKNTLAVIEKAIQPEITSDFDRHVFYGSTCNVLEIIDFSLSFPFGPGKKLVVVKEFEKVKDTAKLNNYLNSAPDFTVLVLIHEEGIRSFENKFFKKLIEQGWIFEAKELKADGLADWAVSYISSKGKKLSGANAAYLVELTGENRSILEMQLEKMLTYLEDKTEITFEMIQSHVISSKEYTIFDLQNAIAVRDKEKAFRVGYNLLERENIIPVIAFLNKYFTGLAQITELNEKKMPDAEAARIVGTIPYYYSGYKSARDYYDNKKLYRISKALLEADLSVKSTSIDEKTVLTILLTKILN